MSIFKLLIRTSICAVSCANISLLSAAHEEMMPTAAPAEPEGVVVPSRPLPPIPTNVSRLTEEALRKATGEQGQGDEHEDDAVSISNLSTFSGISAISAISRVSSTTGVHETEWDPKYKPVSLRSANNLREAQAYYNKAKGQYRLLRKLFVEERREYVDLLTTTTAELAALDSSLAIAPLEKPVAREKRKAVLKQLIADVGALLGARKTRIAELENTLAEKEKGEAALKAKEEAERAEMLMGAEATSTRTYIVTGIITGMGGIMLGVIFKSIWPAFLSRPRS